MRCENDWVRRSEWKCFFLTSEASLTEPRPLESMSLMLPAKALTVTEGSH